jgi:putative ABC transport system permease protein
MRTPILAGRAFSDVDNHVDSRTNTPKQVVIDDQVAALAFPNESPVGKRILARVNTPEAEWFDVIGVVAHQRHASLAVPGPEAIFFADGYFGHGNAARWAVRTAGDPTQLAAAVRAAIADIDPRSIPAEMQPMQAFVDRAMAPIRFTTTLIGVFGVVAVVLAAIGLYGVLGTIVRQRTAEIGMRLVFGAQRSTILALVVGEGLRLSGVGVVLGVVSALAVTRVMRSMVVGVGVTDPLTFVAITVLFGAIAVLASLVPARRAASVDPMVALRDE